MQSQTYQNIIFLEILEPAFKFLFQIKNQVDIIFALCRTVVSQVVEIIKIICLNLSSP